jgi:aminopeptidase-like protein
MKIRTRNRLILAFALTAVTLFDTAIAAIFLTGLATILGVTTPISAGLFVFGCLMASGGLNYYRSVKHREEIKKILKKTM